MKAWQVPALGEPVDVMRLVDDAADPDSGPGQVLVKVHAVALNFPDVLMCRGLYQVRPPLPFTPGVELCGTVVATGPDVTTPAIGDRVLGSPAGGGLAEFALMDAVDALPGAGRPRRCPGGVVPHRVPDRMVRSASSRRAARWARRCSCTPPPAGSAVRPYSSERRPAHG